ncbi:hypothetical protein E4T63_13745 [Pseudomonas fluorescens]|uniref:Uncharacterized protein n=1 Tax=Pseudomonas fluorescens TaxID=294 RepID=A0AAP9CIS6_PSEFL|nr:hypothetical protein E4T63_13745 [Pseudomonas fluorescens]
MESAYSAGRRRAAGGRSCYLYPAFAATRRTPSRASPLPHSGMHSTCGSGLAREEVGSGTAYSTVAHPTPRQQITLQQCNSISLKPNKTGPLDAGTLAALSH